MPKISVIVPVYRVEAYLPRCVESVLHQSFPDFELILVDDGSPDGCPAMCDGYAARDPRIHVIHQKNGGLSAARNTGINWVMAHSQSTYITFLDSDDWIHRDFLRRLYEGAETYGAGIAACGYVHVAEKQADPELGVPGYLVLDGEQAYAEHYGKCMTACCKLIRKEILKDLRFPEGKLHEDAFITHRMVFTSFPVVILEENLYYYYENPESITRVQWDPRRMADMEAHEIRLAFLREHGYQRAAKTELRVTVETIYEHLETLETLGDPRYAEHFQNLRLQLRRALKEAKGLIPLNLETAWYYLMAYPLLPLWHLGKKAQKCWHSRKNNTQKTAQ